MMFHHQYHNYFQILNPENIYLHQEAVGKGQDQYDLFLSTSS